MTTQLQEFFASSETKEELAALLEQSGFEHFPNWETAYQASNVFLDIQDNEPERLGVNLPFENIIVLELYQTLGKFPLDHPLFRFFSSLKEPVALGMGGEPRYAIRKYTQEKI